MLDLEKIVVRERENGTVDMRLKKMRSYRDLNSDYRIQSPVC